MKTKANLSVDKDVLKALKIKALENDMTLSDMLTTAGTITPADVIKKHLEDSQGAATPRR